MDKLIIEMLNRLGHPEKLYLGGHLLDSPEQFNGTLMSAALTLHMTAVKPLTAVILAIMSVIMLSDISSRIDGDRELGVKLVAATMFKIALVFVAVENAPKILEAINNVTHGLGQAANATQVGGGPDGSALSSEMESKIKDASMIEQAGLVMVVFVPFLVGVVASALATVTVYWRFLQIYIMTAFASLPVAFFAHQDTKSMGIGYLKRYATVSLQGVMLILAFKFHGVVCVELFKDALGGAGDENIFVFVLKIIGQTLVAPFLLLFLIFGAGNLAKAVVGEG